VERGRRQATKLSSSDTTDWKASQKNGAVPSISRKLGMLPPPNLKNISFHLCNLQTVTYVGTLRVSSEMGWKGDMEDPRPRSRIDENARCVLGSGDATATATATAMAMAMATRARTATGTSDGEVVTESCNERKEA
jgi:hypothetical protein